MRSLLYLLFVAVPRSDRHIMTLAVAGSTLLLLVALGAELIAA
jgi:hypothetical protein